MISKPKKQSNKKSNDTEDIPSNNNAQSSSTPSANTNSNANTNTPNNKSNNSNVKPPKQKANRVPCECQATNHELMTNCLSCGRIICSQEGPGPCFTCGNTVNKVKRGGTIQNTTQRQDNGLEAATKHKDQLLLYDRTAAQRTVVFGNSGYPPMNTDKYDR